MKQKEYTAADIQVLTDVEHVRLRTNTYVGSMTPSVYKIPYFDTGKIEITDVEFTPSVLKCVNEVLENGYDELLQCNVSNKIIKIRAEPEKGSYTISDNGRGIPIDKHSSGKYTPEVVFTSLKSGRNFKDADRQVGIKGVNGVGGSIVAMVSTEMHIQIHRDGKVYDQSYFNGISNITKPKIKETNSTKTGTSVSFILDSQVFKNTSLSERLIKNRAMEMAFTNPGFTIEYNDEKFKYKRGLEDIIQSSTNNYFKFFSGDMEFFVLFDTIKNIDEQIFTWINGSLLYDGGMCNTQWINAFTDRVIDHLSSQSKKLKCEVTKNDIRENLLILSSLKLKYPEFDSQSKTRLTGPNLKKDFVELIDKYWSLFARRNKEWLDLVLQRAVNRHNKDSNKKAQQEFQKKQKIKVSNLLDATSKVRSNCQCVVTEGISAASQISEIRNPVTTASFSLTGKINNVYGSTPSQLLDMGKIVDLLSVIGLIPGKKAVRSELRYGKILIATDADYDGDAINALLVNLFYQFWPELYSSEYEPFIYRLITPNVVVSKGKNRIHFPTRTAYEKVKDKYKNWNVEYMKGLGSLHKDDFVEVLNNSQYHIPMIDDGKLKDILKLVFSEDVSARKEWLTNKD